MILWTFAELKGLAIFETSAETPAETPVETPAETPAETPVETPVEIPVETPAETAQIPAETSAEILTPAEPCQNSSNFDLHIVDMGRFMTNKKSWHNLLIFGNFSW